MLQLIPQTLATFLGIYGALLIVRVLLTWFPNVDWSNPAFSALSQITDPYLNLFRSIIPPLGGLDFSAMLAIFLLFFVQDQLDAVASVLATSYTAYSGF
ncbi:YggT family protein [Leptolyngbya cf. ectocarpi LEGE 11479]|uniref:YggT family protein n=1 Tax=Leptolyngbya cf. ectocarpi LEGE 11479 TaxID=1828722 RepID=A0A928ZYD6_LEPEC|nr:YggT family protein [Leptolyngbya ectocarpi]MBE9069782.1 YggT family protein [Leptolyngbya cf. ectocarpi LEGE 11479]